MTDHNFKLPPVAEQLIVVDKSTQTDLTFKDVSYFEEKTQEQAKEIRELKIKLSELEPKKTVIEIKENMPLGKYGTKEKPNRYATGKQNPAIRCKKCSDYIDWGQINGEAEHWEDDYTVYDDTGLCLNCYDEEQTEKELAEEV